MTESLARISARRPWVTIGVWLVYVYRIARSLIGMEAAESLMFPPLSSFGVVGWFRLQQRYGHILSKLSPGRRQDSNFARYPRPCSILRCLTRKESATRCPTTCTQKSPPSGEAGRCRHSGPGMPRTRTRVRNPDSGLCSIPSLPRRTRPGPGAVQGSRGSGLP